MLAEARIFELTLEKAKQAISESCYFNDLSF